MLTKSYPEVPFRLIKREKRKKKGWRREPTPRGRRRAKSNRGEHRYKKTPRKNSGNERKEKGKNLSRKRGKSREEETTRNHQSEVGVRLWSQSVRQVRNKPSMSPWRVFKLMSEKTRIVNEKMGENLRKKSRGGRGKKSTQNEGARSRLL